MNKTTKAPGRTQGFGVGAEPVNSSADNDKRDSKQSQTSQPEPHSREGQLRTTQAHDLLEIRRALTVLYQPGDIVELRALDVGGKTVAGYFDDLAKLAASAARLSGSATGVYVVLNQLTPALLARSQNRLTTGPRNLTQDGDILSRRWLPIDIDARRPAGISSTDAEHDVAIRTARAVRTYLEAAEVPHDSVVIGDSGNGGHVLVRIS